ncbi:MAG: DUF6088 family protein [Pseudobdellovibrionaceae bacterium]
MQAIETKVLNRIYGYGRGTCFTPDRFLDYGSDEAIRKSLSRLAKDGIIRRISKGIYEYPQKHQELGIMPPNIESVVKAISQRDHIQTQPSGAYAANLLGLSEQVPAKISYLTNGSSRKIKVGSKILVFKKTNNKALAVAGTTSGLIFEALKFIGKDHIDTKTISSLRRKLSSKDRAQLIKDLKFAPIWMRHSLKEIAGTV